MIVVDIETTGIDPLKNAIVSIGAIEFVNPKNTFYAECKIGEGVEVNPVALQINGLSEEEIRDPKKDSLEDVLHKFKSWMEESSSKVLVGHNIGFDKIFLDTSFRRAEVEPPYADRSLDLHTLAFMHFVREGHEVPMSDGHSKLDSGHVFRYVGLDVERGAHNALEDAKLTAEAVSRLLYDQPLIEEYKKFSIPWK
jgi:DNA polymerase III epsilon subunit-like protein